MQAISAPGNEGVKPGNEARSRWRVGPGVREPWVLLYLHGFTASPGEAGELPEEMAGELQANLYVHCWPGHGEAAPEAMRGLTPELLRASAGQALDRGCKPEPPKFPSPQLQSG